MEAMSSAAVLNSPQSHHHHHLQPPLHSQSGHDDAKVCENHPHGIVWVKYKDNKDARKCIELMNGRWFGGRKIHASVDDGSVNHALFQDLDAEAERLESFGAKLEAD